MHTCCTKNFFKVLNLFIQVRTSKAHPLIPFFIKALTGLKHKFSTSNRTACHSYWIHSLNLKLSSCSLTFSCIEYMVWYVALCCWCFYNLSSQELPHLPLFHVLIFIHHFWSLSTEKASIMWSNSSKIQKQEEFEGPKTPKLFNKEDKERCSINSNRYTCLSSCKKGSRVLCVTLHLWLECRDFRQVFLRLVL